MINGPPLFDGNHCRPRIQYLVLDATSFLKSVHANVTFLTIHAIHFIIPDICVDRVCVLYIFLYSMVGIHLNIVITMMIMMICRKTRRYFSLFTQTLKPSENNFRGNACQWNIHHLEILFPWTSIVCRHQKSALT